MGRSPLWPPFTKGHPLWFRFLMPRIDKRSGLREAEDFVCGLLSPEQSRALEAQLRSSSYGVRDQLLVRFAYDRYLNFATRRETLREVEKVVKLYGFLLNEGPDPLRARCAFMNALSHVVSFGEGAHFSGFHNWRHEFQVSPGNGRGGNSYNRGYKNLESQDETNARQRRRLWSVTDAIASEYPRIPELVQSYNQVFFTNGVRSKSDTRPGYPHCVLRTMEQQLAIDFGPVVCRLGQCHRLNEQKWLDEFMDRHRWHLERLSRCSSVFLDKYRDRLCSDVMCGLGLFWDTEVPRIKTEHIHPPQLPEKDLTFDKEMVDHIVGRLTPEELKLLNDRDEGGREWSFGEQMMDRFRCRYPSFVDLNLLKERIDRKIGEYRPLLRPENLEVVRDVLVDELERELFVTPFAHLWNLEMERNMEEGTMDCEEEKVERAIELLLGMFSEEVREDLAMDKRFRARWRRAMFASTPGHFRDYLNFMALWSPYAPEHGSGATAIELQALLEEIDMFFLYPREGRDLKRRARRLDNGWRLGLDRVRWHFAAYHGVP